MEVQPSALGLGALLVLAGCGAGPPTETTDPAVQIRIVREDLAAGDLEGAESRLRQLRRTAGRDGAVLLWSALCAAMRFDLEGEVDWMRAARGTDLGGLREDEFQGRLGDALFRAGRYAEAGPFLTAGAVGLEGARRQAFAQLTAFLPGQRLEPRQTVAELPLREGNLPVLYCMIGGRERPLVFDTGASFSTLTRRLALELKVTPMVQAGIGRDGLGLEFPIAAGVLRPFAVGDLDLGAHPVLVVDDGRITLRGDESGPVPAGLLGLDVVLRFRFTLDPVRRSLLLEPSSGLDAAGSVPCLLVHGTLRLPVRIEGRELWFVLDTGASHSSLTETGLQTLPGGERRAVLGYRKIHAPGGEQVAVREVRNLTLLCSETRFTGVDLPIVVREDSGLFPLHGVLGSDLLLRARVTIDSARIRITPR